MESVVCRTDLEQTFLYTIILISNIIYYVIRGDLHRVGNGRI